MQFKETPEFSPAIAVNALPKAPAFPCAAGVTVPGPSAECAALHGSCTIATSSLVGVS